MKTRLAAVAALLLLAGMPAAAHRLDEYLQATTISVEKDRVQMQIRLTPGVAVFPIVIASIDADGNGAISEAERRAYAERVLHDLTLTIDGNPLQFRLISFKFPKVEEMKEGSGDIQIELQADVPSGGTNRKLIFTNQHQSGIAAYLVNSLIPRDPDIRLAAQNRDYQQSFYQLNYEQTNVHSELRSRWWSVALPALAAVLLLSTGLGYLRWRRARA